MPEVWVAQSPAQRTRLALGFAEREAKRDSDWLAAAPQDAGAGSDPSAAVPGLLRDVEYDDWKLPGFDDFPRMPVACSPAAHRDKIDDEEVINPFPFNAAVARPVSKRELGSNPAARAAAQTEWDKLRKAGCWDETMFREWSEVAQEAIDSDTKVHVGRVFEIVVEKGAELLQGDPARKFKGRVVYQGNNVKDESWDAAIFSDLGSAPSSMEAAKAVDAYGLLDGNVEEQGDAEQAYTQSKLGGTTTWVRLPREQLPAKWQHMRDPVCRLHLALYGHPDSGGYWESYCEGCLVEAGFAPIADWRSVYWHPKLRLLLVVYVDDFKMSGPAASMKPG
jgi:hypothetical protein